MWVLSYSLGVPLPPKTRYGKLSTLPFSLKGMKTSLFETSCEYSTGCSVNDILTYPQSTLFMPQETEDIIFLSLLQIQVFSDFFVALYAEHLQERDSIPQRIHSWGIKTASPATVSFSFFLSCRQTTCYFAKFLSTLTRILHQSSRTSLASLSLIGICRASSRKYFSSK